MTLRELVDEPGVTRMTLCRHFVDKEDLIKEVLEQRQSFIVDSITEKLGPMPGATTRLKDIFSRHGTWFRTLEFADCLFERVSAEFGNTWPEVIDVAVCYHDDLFAMVETLLKDVVPASTARRFTGVYVTRLANVMADVHAIGDPSAASQA